MELDNTLKEQSIIDKLNDNESYPLPFSIQYQVACEHEVFGDCIECYKKWLDDAESQLSDAKNQIRSLSKQRNGLLTKARALDKINNQKNKIVNCQKVPSKKNIMCS